MNLTYISTVETTERSIYIYIYDIHILYALYIFVRRTQCILDHVSLLLLLQIIQIIFNYIKCKS